MPQRDENPDALLVRIRELEAETAKLRKFEERYNLLIDKLEHHVYRIRIYPKLAVEYMSPSFNELTGYTAEEHYADPEIGLRLVHPDDLPMLQEALATPPDPTKPLILRGYNKDGSLSWTKQFLFPIFDDDGRYIGFESLVTNMSDEKHFREQILIRDRSIECVAKIARLLVNKLFSKETLLEVCQLIGEAAKVDRVDVFRNIETRKGKTGSTLLCEWQAESIDPFPWNRFPAEELGYYLWHEELRNEEIISGNREDFDDDRSNKLAQWKIESFILVPIFIENNYWGVLGLSMESRKRIWTPNEKEAAHIISEMLGSSIVRDMARNRLLAAQIDMEEQVSRRTRQLSKSQTDLRVLIDSLDLIAILLDEKGEILVANQKAAQSLGIERTKLIGTNAYEHFRPNVSRRRKAIHDEVLKSGVPYEYEELTEGRCYFARVLPLKAGIDQTYIAAFIQDISEQKQMEMAHFESEEKFRALAENSTDVIMRFDRHLRHLYANPIVEEQTGIPKEDFIGKTHAELGFPEHLCKIWEEAIEKVFESKEQNRIEFELPNGTWIDWLLIPERTPEGNVQAVIASARDITERKKMEHEVRESEQIFRAIAESAEDSIFIKDTERRYTLANPAMERLLGVPADQIIGKKAEEVFDPASAEIIREVDDPVFAGTVVRAVRTIDIGPNNSTFHVVEVPLVDAKGKVNGICGIVRDITNIKRAEAEREQLQEQLRHSQKMETVGTLAGGIAHDVNNILQTIFNNVHIGLEDLPDDHPVRAQFEAIIRAGRRAKGLIEQILTFSRQMESKKKPIFIGSLVKEVAKMIRPTAPSNIEIHHFIERDSGQILADPSQIHQVVMNLATNSIQAMQDDGGKLEIHLNRVEFESGIGLRPPLKQGSYVRLAVTDTGPGMDDETSSRIFEPFFTTKKVGEGTGLGLSVVHGIVEGHSGAIFVQSQPGSGTTIEVFFPRVEATEDVLVFKEPETVWGQENLLFVDDDEEQVEMLGKILRRKGYNVTVTNSGEEALKHIMGDPHSIDVLITDYMMPHMTGLQLAEAASAVRADMPIIITTGNNSRVDSKKAKAAGISCIINKPFGPEELSGAIRELLDNK